MKVRRVRCPWCRWLTTDLREHVERVHFPDHCTKCYKPSGMHKQSQSSPQYPIPCKGADFVVSGARR